MEKKVWVYQNGTKRVLEYKPSGRLSKGGELMRKHPGGIIDVHDLRAVMR